MSPLAPESVAPTRTDPVAAAASEIIGGPLGRYAGPARHTARSLWQPAAAVLMGLSSLTVAFGVLQKSHCFAKGWNTPDQFWHACYSDLPLVFQNSGLGQAMPYLPGAKPLDQPLVSGLVMSLLGRLVGLAVPDGSVLVQQQWYFALWALLVTLLVMVLVAVTAASVPGAPWRAAHVALSPVLVLAGLVSVDLFGVMLASVALLAWGRGKVTMAGVLFGLAVSARSYPLVLLVAIGLLAVRSGRARAWGRLAGTALATWFAVSLPWLVMNADGLLSAYRGWWLAGASYGSVGLVPSLLGRGLSLGVVTALAIVGWVVALAVGAVFALSLDRRPTVAEISLVMLVIVIVTGKSVPVQAGLWLLPLVALVGIKWRDHLIWAGVEASYFVAVWLYIAGQSKPDRGLPQMAYIALVVLRTAAMIFLLVQVWRMARSREPAVPLEQVETDANGEPVETERVESDAGAGPVGTGPAETWPAGTEPAGTDAGAEPVENEAAATDASVEPVENEHVETDAGAGPAGTEADETGPVDEIDPLAGPMAGAPDAVLVRFG